jgi:aminoglycoside/choline kinase family phosphotransferase
MPHLPTDELARHILPVARELLGGTDARLTTLLGGASLRRYHRVKVINGRLPSLVVMELGDNPLSSEEAAKTTGPVELPFINVHRYLNRAGAPVPVIYRYDSDRGFLYIEDLGDITFESRVIDANDDVRGHYYRQAIDQLVLLQQYASAHPDPECIAFSRGFDYELLKWELDHFREYGLEAQGHRLIPSERDELERIFSWIADELASAPRGFVHRDYQSRNLMVQDTVDGQRMTIIDFQDALLGTRAYDLVGLLRDSYVSLSSMMLNLLVKYYVDRAGVADDSFRNLFDLQVVQRKLKDAGRFVFIDRVKKNPSFLVHIPNSLSYVAQSLSRLPHLANLLEILAKYLEPVRNFLRA